MKHIQELFSKAKEYGDDKVQLAIQTYELVDKHIRRLDSDLARFEGEIHDKAMTAKDKNEESVGKSKLGVGAGFIVILRSCKDPPLRSLKGLSLRFCKGLSLWSF